MTEAHKHFNRLNTSLDIVILKFTLQQFLKGDFNTEIIIDESHFDYLIQTIRDNNYQMVKKLLSENPNLVNFYDKVRIFS